MSEHTDKYDALIEKMGGLNRVESLIPFGTAQVKAALEKGDEHLNTLPLARWDLVCKNQYSWPVNTLAERVCLLKRAAYLIATM